MPAKCQHQSEEAKQKIAKARRVPNPKIDSIHHLLIRRLLGGRPANHCEVCGKSSPGVYHWANLDHNYSNNPDDWIEICPGCHRNYDLGKIRIRGLTIEDRGGTKLNQSEMTLKGWNTLRNNPKQLSKRNKNVSISLMGHIPWNKGLSGYSTGSRSQEFKDRQAERMRNNNPMSKPDVRQKMINSLQGRVHTEYTKLKMSLAQRRRWRELKEFQNAVRK